MNSLVHDGDAVTIALESGADIAARDVLLDRSMAPNWKKKTSGKLRAGRKPAEGLAFVARDNRGEIVGTVRLWNIQAGIDEGATLVTGGTGKPDGLDTGYYVKPTIFANVTNSMTIARVPPMWRSVRPAADIASAYWSTSSCSKSATACAPISTGSAAPPPGTATKPISHHLQVRRSCVDSTAKSSATVTVRQFKSWRGLNRRHLHKARSERMHVRSNLSS